MAFPFHSLSCQACRLFALQSSNPPKHFYLLKRKWQVLKPLVLVEKMMTVPRQNWEGVQPVKIYDSILVKLQEEKGLDQVLMIGVKKTKVIKFSQVLAIQRAQW